MNRFITGLAMFNHFDIDRGKVKILGVENLILPVEVLDMINSPLKDAYKKLKAIFKHIFREYFIRFDGNTYEQKFNYLQDLLNTMGIGYIHVDMINSGKKFARIQLHDSPIVKLHIENKQNSSKPICYAINAILAGAFSSFYNTDVNSEEVKCAITGSEYCVFVIKPQR